MRAVIALLAVLAAACSRADQRTAARHDSAAADSARHLPPPPQPDPVITDTTAIFLAHNVSTEPFWTVEVLNEGIRYRWAENRTGVVFPAGHVDGDDSSSVWTAKRANPGPKTIQMQILKLPCTDGTRGGSFGYRVALLVDGRQHLGCAKGAPR